jgi:hypothetical protein
MLDVRWYQLEGAMPEESRRRRGRPPRPEPAEQSGYRITDSQRRHLHLAMAFTSARSLQVVIDQAVAAYLQTLRETVPGFADAADAHVTGRPDNLRRLPRRS